MAVEFGVDLLSLAEGSSQTSRRVPKVTILGEIITSIIGNRYRKVSYYAYIGHAIKHHKPVGYIALYEQSWSLRVPTGVPFFSRRREVFSVEWKLVTHDGFNEVGTVGNLYDLNLTDSALFLESGIGEIFVRDLGARHEASIAKERIFFSSQIAKYSWSYRLKDFLAMLAHSGHG